jgi:hypothetical protein
LRVEDGRLACRQDDRRDQDSAARSPGIQRTKAPPQGSRSGRRSVRLAV